MPEYSPARWWRLRGPLLRFQGSNCPNCGVKHFPPRPICPEPNCPSRQTMSTQPEIVYQANEDQRNNIIIPAS